MQGKKFSKTISSVKECMEKGGFCRSEVYQFNSTANQLLSYMNDKNRKDFDMGFGLTFLSEQYGMDLGKALSPGNQVRLRHIQMISECQIHGAVVYKRHKRQYVFPDIFKEAVEGFLSQRRYQGITEKNIKTTSLYLERYFSYLETQKVLSIAQITIHHTDGFLRFQAGFSNQIKDHAMRAVRQFMNFCFKNGYHPLDLSEHIPQVHYEKRARIPSAYSYDDVMKLLGFVDRSNPIGKRNYAILLTIARLGLRAGDLVNLQFENINWEEGRISLTQHKTGRPLSMPLLEDVGMAIIDYLRFGRPTCECNTVFLRHAPTASPFACSGGIYSMVSHYIGRAGLAVQGKKRGPHALRHSLASRLLEENVPLPVISEILGHTNTDTTAVYLSISIDKLRNCALEV
jgi:site-specific recombinase XerD